MKVSLTNFKEMTRTQRRIYQRSMVASAKRLEQTMLENYPQQRKALASSLNSMPFSVRVRTAWRILKGQFA